RITALPEIACPFPIGPQCRPAAAQSLCGPAHSPAFLALPSLWHPPLGLFQCPLSSALPACCGSDPFPESATSFPVQGCRLQCSQPSPDHAGPCQTSPDASRLAHRRDGSFQTQSVLAFGGSSQLIQDRR